LQAERLDAGHGHHRPIGRHFGRRPARRRSPFACHSCGTPPIHRSAAVRIRMSLRAWCPRLHA